MTFRRLLLMGTAALFISACENGETRSSNSPSGSSEKPSVGLSIDYEKFTLENGLDVILQVDRSDPIVAVTTVIHAGSNRENRAGLALRISLNIWLLMTVKMSRAAGTAKLFPIGADKEMVGHGQTVRFILRSCLKTHLIKFFGSIQIA